MLAVTNTVWPEISIGTASASWIRRATLVTSAGVLEILDQHHELVSAGATDRVLGPDRGAEPVRNLDQQAVAGVVPEALGDHLVLVEAEVEHGEQVLGVAGRAGDHARQAVEEQRPVGEVGEAVVERLVEQLALHLAALKDLVLQPDVGLEQLGGALLDAGVELVAGAAELELEALALGDVLADRDHRDRNAVGVEHDVGQQLDRKAGAVLADVHRLAAPALDRARFLLAERAPGVAWRVQADRLAEQLLRA